MRPSSKMKAAVVAAACVAGGAVAGIAGAAASTSTSSSPKAATHDERGWFGFRERGFGPHALAMRGIVGPAVHVQAVVLNKAGTGFITVTEDRGTVQSVSGDQLTIEEAIDGVTYRTVTLTIPSGATVMRNFQSSKLSGLRSGDRVRVAQSSEGTTVFAFNLSALPKPPDVPGQKWGPASLPAPPPAGA